MKRSIRRAGAAGTTALCGVLLLSGCNAHPGQAAYVGHDAISVDTLQHVLTNSLQTSCGRQSYASQPIVLERLKLSSLVLGQLLQQAGDRLGVSVSDNDVQAQLASLSDHYGFRAALEQQAAQSGAISASDLPQSVRDDLLRQAIEDKLTSSIRTPDSQLQQYYQAHLDQYLFGRARAIVVSSKQQADQIVSRLKTNPQQFDQILQQVASTSAGQRLNNADSVRRGGYIGLIPLTGLKGAGYPVSPGSVFAVQQPNGWFVLDIISSQSFSDVKQQVRRDLLAAQRQQALSQVLSQQLKRTPVTINPRFGMWDAKQHVVVPSNNAAVAQGNQPFATQLQCGGQG